MRKSLVGVFVAGLSVSGCLFSTTPPERREEPGSSNNPDLVVVTGLVRHYDRTDSHYRNMPGRPVLVEWISTTRDRDGRLVVLQDYIVFSEGSGVYRSEYADPRLGSVRIRPFLCIERAPDLDCCLDLENPCQECQVWMPPVTLPVAPGERVQKDLIVPCDHVP